MEEEVNKEAQRDEVSKTLGEIKRRLLSSQNDLEQLKNQNRVSIGSSAKEIQNLEKHRQELIKDLQRVCSSHSSVCHSSRSKFLRIRLSCFVFGSVFPRGYNRNVFFIKYPVSVPTILFPPLLFSS